MTTPPAHRVADIKGINVVAAGTHIVLSVVLNAIGAQDGREREWLASFVTARTRAALRPRLTT